MSRATSPAVSPSSATSDPGGRLALALQEVLTATVRIRAKRQLPHDAAVFRAQLRERLRDAEQAALRAGYPAEYARLALYAATAFVDESVMGAGHPVLAGWAQRPLQDELFGGLVGGELFFQQLHRLLAEPDSAAVADLLEVYELCLRLGFRGRYGMGATGELDSVLAATSAKIRRIRGAPGPFAPTAEPPAGERAPAVRDPWVRRGAYAVACCTLAVVLLYAGFTTLLRTDVAAAVAATPAEPTAASP